jgi:drug/metabolite transporter (DMT)-like permease
MEYIGPFTMIGVRFIIGAAVLVPVILLFERGKSDREEKKRTVLTSLIVGSILFFASAFQQVGIEVTGSAGVSGFITGLYTVFIPIVSYLLFRQKTSLSVWLGALCALAGLALLCYHPGQGLRFGYGELLLLVGAFFWTAHVMVIDRMGKRVRSIRLSAGQFLVCGLWGVAAMFIFEQPDIGAILDAKWPILYCAIMSSGVAYTLQIIAQKKADPTVAAIVFSSEAMFSALGGAIFKIDKIAPIGYVGCTLMFCGIVLSQIRLGRRKHTQSLDE